jgi:hypothetical protein
MKAELEKLPTGASAAKKDGRPGFIGVSEFDIV